MSFTELFCRSGGSNLNGGGLASGAEPPVAAAFTSLNGNWDGTSIFTPTDGSTPASTVSVGDFASVYLDGATVAVYLARVTAVAAGVNGAVTLSTTAKSGSAPSSGATGRTIKVGGAWKGPNAAEAFPFGVVTSALTDSAGDTPRVNLKNDGTYSITGTILTGTGSGVVVQGYAAAPGDLGKATIDGGTSGASFALLAFQHSRTYIADLIFQNNGASGNQPGFQVQAGTGGDLIVLRCVAHDLRGDGFQNNTSQVQYVECEAYNCNQSNTANSGGWRLTGTAFLVRCFSHDNTGNANSGFVNNSSGLSLFEGCVADSNGLMGFSVGSGSNEYICLNCVAYNNGSHGFVGASFWSYYENCIATKNGGAGISISSAKSFVVNCGFGTGTQANTSGAISGTTNIVGQINFAANTSPFVDAANGDFRISLAAAKGAGRGTFTQTAASYAGTVGFPDLGSAQHLETTDYPAATNVRSGISFNFGASTGNLTLPAASDVHLGVQYGANGTEYTGTFGGSTPPNAPALSVVDNANGTGAVATIAGGSADATHKVYVGTFSGETGAITLTLAGSRTGNGTVPLTLAVGYYLALATAERDDDAVAGNVDYFAVTDATQSVHYQCLLAIQARLRALALPGVDSDNVVVRWRPTIREQQGGEALDAVPMITISPAGQEQMLGVMNETDDIGYPCLVVLWDANPDMNTNLARGLKWREDAISALREQTLAGVDDVEIVHVEPAAVVDAGQWKDQYLASGFVARCIGRQQRG